MFFFFLIFYNVVHFQFSKCNPGFFFLLFRKELTAAECACVNVSGQYGAVHNGQLVGCSFWGEFFCLLICMLSVGLICHRKPF